MSRIVRITANEARTLDRDDRPHGKNNSYTCMQCGHLGVFHTMGNAASFCQVKDCKCETWNMDYEDQVAREKAALSALYEKAYSPWRWLLPVVVAVGGFAIGYYWPF